MRYAVAAALMMALVVGCSNKKPDASKNSSALDVTPIATTPAPMPVISDTPTITPAPAAMGSTYTVKKGDTLYSLARTKYGDAKQWKRIAQANPGVNPQSLKVGQTLVMP